MSGKINEKVEMMSYCYITPYALPDVIKALNSRGIWEIRVSLGENGDLEVQWFTSDK